MKRLVVRTVLLGILPLAVIVAVALPQTYSPGSEFSLSQFETLTVPQEAFATFRAEAPFVLLHGSGAFIANEVAYVDAFDASRGISIYAADTLLPGQWQLRFGGKVLIYVMPEQSAQTVTLYPTPIAVDTLNDSLAALKAIASNTGTDSLPHCPAP